MKNGILSTKLLIIGKENMLEFYFELTSHYDPVVKNFL